MRLYGIPKHKSRRLNDGVFFLQLWHVRNGALKAKVSLRRLHVFWILVLDFTHLRMKEKRKSYMEQVNGPLFQGLQSLRVTIMHINIIVISVPEFSHVPPC